MGYMFGTFMKNGHLTIKKGLAIVICNVFYFAGDLISRIMGMADFLGFMYPAYNWCMIKSVDINDKYDLDCWE